jgi:outer membrane protein assembly factor BamB
MKPIPVLVYLACVFFVPAAWSQQPASNSHAAWTEFHRPDMTRVNPYEKLLNVNNVGNLGLKWRFKTGDTIWSSPAVVDGVVYVGSLDHHLYALDADTGHKLWSFTAGDLVQTSPAVANGIVYFGSWDDNVYALNAHTGKLLWKFVTGGHVLSSPTVAEGVVYVGSWDGNLYALNAKTGARLWSYQTGCANLVAASVLRPPWPTA